MKLMAQLNRSTAYGANMTTGQLANIFTYHKPFGDQPARYELLREAGGKLATLINELCPESREKSLALTYTQQVIMWANASIAINESEKPNVSQNINIQKHS